jgi:hypothetical protein
MDVREQRAFSKRVVASRNCFRSVRLQPPFATLKIKNKSENQSIARVCDVLTNFFTPKALNSRDESLGLRHRARIS